MVEGGGKEGFSGISRLAFRNAGGDRDWFFTEFLVDGHQRGVVVKQYRHEDRVLEWELRAEESYYEDGSWTFLRGVLTGFDPDSRLPAGVPEVFEQRFMPTLNELPSDILNSLRPTAELGVGAMRRMLDYHRNLPARTRQLFRTTVWHRLASPLACVLAALLGVGLGAAPARQGRAFLGFALAIGLMIAYYVTSQMAVVLGENGMLPPFVAGAVPTLLFLAIGGVQVFRNR
jgi:lipopolysaccharide export system permease protein